MGKYPHGLFTWTDIQLPDQEAGKNFYGKVFGWAFTDVPIDIGGTYSMASSGDKIVAAISSQAEEQQRAGIPPMWNSYITVDDVDKLASQVGDLGGTVIMDPFDVMEDGRMAVIQDPTGGIVSLWQPKSESGQGSEIFNVAGAMTWNELATRDIEAAKAFYSELIGWDFNVTESEQMTYHEIRNDGRSNGGMLQMDERWPAEIPAHWMVYFNVEDCDATVQTIEENGGTVSVPPTAIQVGRFSVVQDPQGGIFTVISYNEETPIDQPV